MTRAQLLATFTAFALVIAVLLLAWLKGALS